MAYEFSQPFASISGVHTAGFGAFLPAGVDQSSLESTEVIGHLQYLKGRAALAPLLGTMSTPQSANLSGGGGSGTNPDGFLAFQPLPGADWIAGEATSGYAVLVKLVKTGSNPGVYYISTNSAAYVATLAAPGSPYSIVSIPVGLEDAAQAYALAPTPPKGGNLNCYSDASGNVVCPGSSTPPASKPTSTPLWPFLAIGAVGIGAYLLTRKKTFTANRRRRGFRPNMDHGNTERLIRRAAQALASGASAEDVKRSLSLTHEEARHILPAARLMVKWFGDDLPPTTQRHRAPASAPAHHR